MTVLTFGSVTDIVGKSSIDIDGVSTTDELRVKLESTYPALRNITFAIAVNKKIVTTSTPLVAAASVALLPPFSGG